MPTTTPTTGGSAEWETKGKSIARRRAQHWAVRGRVSADGRGFALATGNGNDDNEGEMEEQRNRAGGPSAVGTGGGGGRPPRTRLWRDPGGRALTGEPASSSLLSSSAKVRSSLDEQVMLPCFRPIFSNHALT